MLASGTSFMLFSNVIQFEVWKVNTRVNSVEGKTAICWSINQHCWRKMHLYSKMLNAFKQVNSATCLYNWVIKLNICTSVFL